MLALLNYNSNNKLLTFLCIWHRWEQLNNKLLQVSMLWYGSESFHIKLSKLLLFLQDRLGGRPTLADLRMQAKKRYLQLCDWWHHIITHTLVLQLSFHMWYGPCSFNSKLPKFFFLLSRHGTLAALHRRRRDNSLCNSVIDGIAFKLTHYRCCSCHSFLCKSCFSSKKKFKVLDGPL